MVTYKNSEALPDLDESDTGQVNNQSASGTSLVLDVDSHLVRGVLFDTVEGQTRLVASAQVMSTLGPPISDMSVAIREVVSILESQTGIDLGHDDDSANRIGPVTITGYPIEPLRVVIVPTGNDQLTSLLLSTGRSTPSIVRILSDGVRTEDGVLSSTLLEFRLREIRPDVVLLLEGDRAQTEWASAVGTFKNLAQEQDIEQLVVLASDEFQQYISQTLGESVTLTGLDPDQYEPNEVALALETELAALYNQRVKDSIRPGITPEVEFVSRVRGDELATRFISRRMECTVVAVDVSAGSSVSWSSLHSGRSITRPDLDVHANILALFGGGGIDPVWSRMPNGQSREELSNWILNRASRPRVLSSLESDQVIESALLSGAISRIWDEAGPATPNQIDMIVGGPGFCFETGPALSVLTLLNALNPKPQSGVVQIVLDPDGLLHAAGSAGQRAPGVAADVIEQDLLQTVATVIIVEGSGSVGQRAISGKLTFENGESREFMVPYGSLSRIPLSEGEQATLILTCDAGFAVGQSNPGEQLLIGPEDRLQGGEVGLIIDARGGLLEGPLDREIIRRWFADLDITL